MPKSRVGPRVVIDARYVAAIPHGAARYIERIAQGLRAMEGELKYQPHFLVSPATPEGALSGFDRSVLHAPYLHPKEWIEIPAVLKRLGAAAYHSPTFASLPRCPVPSILTIHDLIHLHFNGIAHRQYYRFLLRPFARRASELVTVSEFSRGEIASWLGVPRESIEIVWNAMDPKSMKSHSNEEIESVLSKFQLQRGKYFLCMSNPKPHKNVTTLVKAYREYRKIADHRSEAPWKLVLNFRGYENEPGILCLAGPDEREGQLWLSGAGAVAFPSLYEGFGIPPVEAALAGVPVAVSRIPPHEEGLAPLQGEGLVWVDPKDVDAWAKVLGDLSLGTTRVATVARRQALLDRFDFRKTGRDMDRIYRRVLGLEA